MQRFFFAVALSALALSVAPVRAVMTGGNLDTTDGTGVAGFNNVGSFNSASAVYIGNNWVLTAVHVFDLDPNASISFSNTTLTPDGTSHILTNPNSTNSELVLMHVSGDTSSLANLPSLATSAPVFGAPITMIGEGAGRSSPPTIDTPLFYDVEENQPPTVPPTFTWTPTGSAASPTNAGGFAYQAHAKRWGNSSVANEDGNSANPVVFLDPTSNSFGFESFFYGSSDATTALNNFLSSDKSGAGDAALADDDSGGGVFSNGVLIGINDLKTNFMNQPGDTAVFGNGSFFIDISTYESQIATFTGVPEPTSLAFAAAGFIFLSRRRR